MLIQRRNHVQTGSESLKCFDVLSVLKIMIYVSNHSVHNAMRVKAAGNHATD